MKYPSAKVVFQADLNVANAHMLVNNVTLFRRLFYSKYAKVFQPNLRCRARRPPPALRRGAANELAASWMLSLSTLAQPSSLMNPFPVTCIGHMFEFGVFFFMAAFQSSHAS